MLRLFIAFRLPATIAAHIADWQVGAFAGTGVRLVPRDHLHITLVFLGSRPPSDVDAVVSTMQNAVATARRPAFQPYRYRETSRAGMLVLREDPVGTDHYGGRANELTGTLMRALERRGLYRREYRSWTPHITIARFKRPPSSDRTVPDLGSFGPTDVVLFESRLATTGSVYAQLAAVPLPDHTEGHLD